MPVSCDTTDAPTLVRYSFNGDWLAREINERRLELIQAGHLTAASAVLFDLRPTSTFPNLADLHTPLQDDAVWPTCRAFLVTTQSQAAMARELQAVLGPHSVINETFHDESRALEWLSALTGRGCGPKSTV
jgi:hypothetical protein